jgi:hypothetical protein
MLFGAHPLVAYAVVGLGAAAYGPAKYGILTELLPPSLLVKGNGWIEGLTIGSIILGILLGGQLIGPRLSGVLLGFDFPGIDFGVDRPAEAAIASMVLVYILAAAINLYIPRTDAPLQRFSGRTRAHLEAVLARQRVRDGVGNGGGSVGLRRVGAEIHKRQHGHARRRIQRRGGGGRHWRGPRVACALADTQPPGYGANEHRPDRRDAGPRAHPRARGAVAGSRAGPKLPKRRRAGCRGSGDF